MSAEIRAQAWVSQYLITRSTQIKVSDLHTIIGIYYNPVVTSYCQRHEFKLLSVLQHAPLSLLALSALEVFMSIFMAT